MAAGKHLDAVGGQARRHAVDDGDHDAGHRRDRRRDRPGHREHALDGNAERLRHLLVERGGAHRKAVFRGAEEPGHADHHRDRHHEAHDIDGLDLQAEQADRLALEHARERLRVDAEDPFQRGLEHGGQADRHHDDGDDRLADHRPQDQDLDRDAEDEHEHQRHRHADPERHLVFGEQRPAHPGADQQQFALREIDDLRRLVDQHERHRDHAIERADHEAVDEELDQECGVHSAASASRGLAREVDHLQRGADALGGAVLEADHGVDGNAGVAAIDRVDDPGIFLVDDAAADLSGAGQFAVVGVELLVEQQESRDALRRRQRGVDRSRPPSAPARRLRGARRGRCRS